MTALGCLLASVSAFANVPQTFRLVRTRLVEGLSVTTQLSWTASWLLWLIYSTRIQAWPKAGAETVGLLAEVTLTVTLLRVLTIRGRAACALRVAAPFAMLGVAASLGRVTGVVT